MSDSQLSPGGYPPGLPVDLMQELQKELTPEEMQLLIKSVEFAAGAFRLTASWVETMRALRNSLHARNGAGQSGWDRICRRIYKLPRNNANAMIRGWEALFLEKDGAPAEPPLLLGDPSPSFYRELGNVPDELRPRMVKALSMGDIDINASSVLRHKKVLKKKQGTTLQVQKPKEPSKSPTKLPSPDPKAKGGPTISRSTYGDLPERAQEFKYLKGRDAANEKLAEDMAKLLRASSQSGSGKLTRLRVLSEALHREFKSVGDRYHGKWDKASHYPRYMTLWQQLWIEEGSLTLYEELNGIRREISEANRYSSIANMHLHVEDLEMTD